MEKYTEGQKNFLYESLRKQTSKKTPYEKELLENLRIENSNKENNLYINNVENIAKQIHLDNFGEHYKNRWSKIKEDKKGYFIKTSYLGKKYINK